MHSEINLFLPLRLLFLAHVGFVLVVDEVHNGRPRVAVVNVVTEARRVDDCQLGLKLFLLEFSLDNLDFGQLVQLLLVTAIVVLGRREFR